MVGPHAAFCTLHFALCILHLISCARTLPARSPAALRPNNGSLAHHVESAEQHPCSTGPPHAVGRPAPSRKIKWEKSLREKHPTSSGGIIGIPGQRIKAGWRGCAATQVLISQGIVELQNGIRSAGSPGRSDDGSHSPPFLRHCRSRLGGLPRRAILSRAARPPPTESQMIGVAHDSRSQPPRGVAVDFQ
jgi:hypothetical protein